MYRFFLAILLIPLLIGCDSQELDVLPLASDSTASIADPQPPQPTAYPGPNRTTPLAGEEMDAGDSSPPQASPTPAEPAPIHWKTVASKQGKLKELVGISGRARFYAPSPDGRWFLAEFWDIPSAPSTYPLYVLDSEGNDHWLMTELTSGSFTWTEDSRLLWIDIDGEQLFIANGDGSQRRELAAPEPVMDVWYGGPSTALVAGQERFWRVNLEAETWDPVLDSGGQPLAVPHFNDNDTVTASPDGTFATLIDNTKDDIYRIPLAAGEPAVQVASFEIEPWGTDARIGPVAPLANSPLWVPAQPYDFSAGRFSRDGGGVFVDSTTGEFIPVTKFPPQGTPGYRPAVSPDGRWFILNKQASPTSAPDDRVLYIASSTDPYGGRVIDIDAPWPAGWIPEADLALLITNEGDLVRLDLQTGSTQRILEGEFVTGEDVIVDGNETIFVMEGHKLGEAEAPALPGALERSHEKEAVHAFTLEGHKLGELEAPAPPGALERSYETVVLRGALMFRKEDEDDSDDRIWLWEPVP